MLGFFVLLILEGVILFVILGVLLVKFVELEFEFIVIFGLVLLREFFDMIFYFLILFLRMSLSFEIRGSFNF